MLRQRRKDIEFRVGLQDRLKKNDTDAEAIVDKVVRKEMKIKQIENEKFQLKNQIKEKDIEIQKIKNS